MTPAAALALLGTVRPNRKPLAGVVVTAHGLYLQATFAPPAADPPTVIDHLRRAGLAVVLYGCRVECGDDHVSRAAAHYVWITEAAE